MSLSALALYAVVYFAAVATPGPGVAALVAQVLAQGLATAGRESLPGINAALASLAQNGRIAFLSAPPLGRRPTRELLLQTRRTGRRQH